MAVTHSYPTQLHVAITCSVTTSDTTSQLRPDQIRIRVLLKKIQSVSFKIIKFVMLHSLFYSQFNKSFSYPQKNINYFAKEFAEMDRFFSYVSTVVMNCRIRDKKSGSGKKGISGSGAATLITYILTLFNGICCAL